MASPGSNLDVGPPCLRDRLLQSPPSLRRGLMVELLRCRVSGPLGLEPSQIGSAINLLEIGIDSLKAVEFKTLLESEFCLELSSSLVFDYPTLDALSAFLLEKIDAWPDASSAGSDEAQGHDILSEEQLSALLSVELRELNPLEDKETS